MNLIARLVARLAFPDDGPLECWVWTGTTTRGGYGLISDAGRKRLVHRVYYEHYTGQPIPEGKILLHTCDNPPCINPEHLLVGTQRDNMNDMYAKGRRYGAPKKPVCKRGHPREGDNLRNGSCVQCYNITRREWRQRRKAAGLPS